MKKYIFGILFLFPLLSMSQGMYVKEGNVFVSDDTHLTINNSNLEVDGKLNFKDNSVLFLNSDTRKLYVFGDIVLQNVLLNSDCIFDSDITVNGDINFKSGIADILSNTLYLNGLLVNEREDSYIFSSETGEIVVRKNITSGVHTHPGNMGLDLILNDYSGELEIKRSNAEIYNAENKSILRTYRLEPAVDISNIEFSYFNHEKNNLDDKNFSVWFENNLYWNPLKSLLSSSNKITTSEAKNVSCITVFYTTVNIDIDFPTGFSPNDDGVNDSYVIGGLEKYPNNEFIVFNQWGDIVYSSSPYNNHWDGYNTHGVSFSSEDKLLDGTYFYYFFKDRKNKNDIIKGFFEIRTK